VLSNGRPELVFGEHNVALAAPVLPLRARPAVMIMSSTLTWLRHASAHAQEPAQRDVVIRGANFRARDTARSHSRRWRSGGRLTSGRRKRPTPPARPAISWTGLQPELRALTGEGVTLILRLVAYFHGDDEVGQGFGLSTSDLAFLGDIGAFLDADLYSN
jgi:hypothetical protein